MSATNHTPNLNLSQFIPLDKPAWLGDYNSDMSKIDTAVHKVQTQADSMETAVEQATTAAQAATQAAQAATEAAQDAADKAQDAETTANNVSGSATQALTIAQQAQADVAKKVSKTGDTMTGMLAFGGSNNGITGSVDTEASISVITQPSDSEMLERLNLGTNFGPMLHVTSDPSHTDVSGKVVVLRTDADKTNVALDGSNHLRIKKIMDPVDNQDAATKAYVDAKTATRAYVDANAGGVSSYTNPTPGAHVSSCFGTAVVVGKLLIVDAVITINNILNSGDILFEFASTGISAGDGIGGIMSAAHTSDAAYTSKDISIGFFGGDITVSYGGSSFGSNGNVYRVTFYAKLR